MQEPPNLQTENEPPQPPVQGQRFPLITVTGVVLGICLALFAARWFWGDSSPTLTPERLQQARKQWAAANIRDYRVEVAVQSRQQEVYAVEVREGALQRHPQPQPSRHRSRQG